MTNNEFALEMLNRLRKDPDGYGDISEVYDEIVDEGADNTFYHVMLAFDELVMEGSDV